jgi:hypothetical protein
VNNSLLRVGLSSWIIQDGNYADFKKGDLASFALQLYTPTNCLEAEAECGQVASLTHVRSSFYHAVGKVVHLARSIGATSDARSPATGLAGD